VRGTSTDAGFGVRAYKKVGTDAQLLAAYESYQQCCACLKLDWLFQVALDTAAHTPTPYFPPYSHLRSHLCSHPLSHASCLLQLGVASLSLLGFTFASAEWDISVGTLIEWRAHATR